MKSQQDLLVGMRRLLCKDHTAASRAQEPVLLHGSGSSAAATVLRAPHEGWPPDGYLGAFRCQLHLP